MPEQIERALVEYYYDATLKACPFCGTEGMQKDVTNETYIKDKYWVTVVNDGSYGRDGVAEWIVWCSNCKATTGRCFSKEVALKYWNMRV